MDTVTSLLLAFISIVLINNLVFTKFLGICPYLGVSGRIDMAFGMGMAVTFVVTLSGTLTWLIDHLILMPYGLEVTRYICFILVIASAVQLVEMYLRKFVPSLYESFGIFLPLITTNCAILGLCLFINLWGIDNLTEAVVLSFGAGVGLIRGESVVMVCSDLISEPPTYLIVAIDGLTDETNSVYRVGAKLAPVLEGIRQLAQMKRQRNQEFPRLHMRYIVMKHNQHELPQLQSFAAENSFDLLTVRALSIITTGDSPHKDLLPDLEQYRAYRYRKGQRIKRHDFVCMQAFCYPGVFTDGRVVPCDQDFNATQAYGRIGNGVSFSDLWFSKRTAATRKVIRNDRETFSFCTNCPFADHSSNTWSLKIFWPTTNKSMPVG